MKIKKFVCNALQENAYVVSSGDSCVIIDPGFATAETGAFPGEPFFGEHGNDASAAGELSGLYKYLDSEGLTPEAILAYYDEMGFFDWEQPGTGTKMLKAQHPELETWAYGKHAAMLSCADCHMPTVTMENGMQYHDHHRRTAYATTAKRSMYSSPATPFSPARSGAPTFPAAITTGKSFR